ncbi:MAG: carbohydrate kinase family protein [Bacteroidales bacterium]|nr:carbohydrate kinase family protein [Bacteroidales bacterium]
MPSGKSFTVSGTGCALLDYLYKPVDFNNPAFLKILSKTPGDGGLSPGKLVFTEEFEKFSEKPYALVRDNITGGKPPIAVNIGGPSIVSLIHAAQMLHGFPAEVRFYGCSGADQGGAFINKKLKTTPLKIGLYKTGKQFTPFTDVLSDPDYDGGHGERIFINNIGAAWEFMPDDLDESFFQSDLVVFGGTALVPNIHRSLHELLIKAKQHGAITMVNTVYDFLNEKQHPHLPWPLGNSIETYRFIDLLVTDMEEAFRLTGTRVVDRAIDFFRSRGVGAAIITHGSNPVHFFADNPLFGQIAASGLPVSSKVLDELKKITERAGDTTGCGDNFVGGVIASLVKQLIQTPGKKADLMDAIALGVASGGYACFYHGGTYDESSPGKKQNLVDDYYKDYLKQVGLV